MRQRRLRKARDSYHIPHNRQLLEGRKWKIRETLNIGVGNAVVLRLRALKEGLASNIRTSSDF